MSENSELLQEFVTEAEELLSGMDDAILVLEKSPENTETLNEIFRVAHSIKGGAGFLGMSNMVSVAHAMENLLDKLRSGAFLVDTFTIDTILSAIDCLKSLVKFAKTGESGTCGQQDVIEQIELVMQMHEDVKAGEKTSQINSRVLQDGPPTEKRDTLEKEKPLSTPPDSASDRSRVMVAAPSSKHEDSDTIRVETSRLDQVMNLVGELVLTRNRLETLYSRDNQDLSETVSGLSRITSELQGAVIKTRMQPIKKILGKYPRMVRDIGRKLGKTVDFEMSGEDTELDKSVLEELSDPLTHIIRNSLDHGLETVSERIASGKKEAGKIKISARQDGGTILVEISDDGRGINAEKVKAKAIEKNLLSAEAAAQLSSEDLVNLVFLPGFSTAETVTDLSGRGVGMDVVKSNIEKIKGSVFITSSPGVGTTTTIQLPLTMAIIQALMLPNREELYAVPLQFVTETFFVSGDEIKTIMLKKVLNIRNNVVPLYFLDELTGHSQDISAISYTKKDFHVVVFKSLGREFAIATDGLPYKQEVVVKNPGVVVSSCRGIAGATVVGNGSVVLILDVEKLIRTDSLRQVYYANSSGEVEHMEVSLKPQEGGFECFEKALYFSYNKKLFAVDAAMSHEIHQINSITRVPHAVKCIAGIVNLRGKLVTVVDVDAYMNGKPAKEILPSDRIVVVSHDDTWIGLLADVVYPVVDIEPDHIEEFPALKSKSIIGLYQKYWISKDMVSDDKDIHDKDILMLLSIPALRNNLVELIAAP